MGKQRRKRGNYAERKNKDGSISRFSIPTIKGKPKWVKIPNVPHTEGRQGGGHIWSGTVGNMVLIGRTTPSRRPPSPIWN